MRPETDRMRPETDRKLVSIRDAATALGITSDAIRARLHRGTLAGVKTGRTWQVWLPTGERPECATERPDATGTRLGAERDATDALIAQLRDENRYLRQQLDHQTQITGMMARRLAELPATIDVTDAVQDANPAPQRVVPSVEASAPSAPATVAMASGWRRWWQRIRRPGRQ